MARRGLSLAEAAGDGELLKNAQQSLAMCLTDLGRTEEALAFLEERGFPEGELLETVHGRRTIALYNEGVKALQANDYQTARERFEMLTRDPRVESERKKAAAKSLQSVFGLHAQAEVASGRLEAGQELYQRALSVASSRNDEAGQANIHLRLAVLRSGVGDPAGASVHAEKGAKLAEKVKDPKLAGEAWMVLGDLRFDSDVILAREAYAKALASWGNDLALLARRANVTYNLAALEAHEGEIAAAQERFSVARDLALRAGDAGLVARVDEILLRLESE